MSFAACPCGEPIGSILHRPLSGGEVWCSRCGGLLLPAAGEGWQRVTFHKGTAAFVRDPNAERLESMLRAIAFCEHERAKRSGWRWCPECGATKHLESWTLAVTAAVLRAFFERAEQSPGGDPTERREALFRLVGGEEGIRRLRRQG